MRKIYIHCGTHKTGSTSLQEFLSVNSDLLNQNGYLYPVSGKNSSLNGQHNLAWELSRGRLYRTSYGNFRDLFGEISEFDGDVILSSEGFECSLCHHERWKSIIEELKSLGFSVTIVIYVRNQISYFESLYAQLLNGWHAGEYLSYTNQVLSTGKLLVDDAEFNFDYFHVINKLTGLRDVDFVFRNYHRLEGQSVISDFLSLLGLDTANCPAQLERNVRDSLYSSFRLFYRNRKGKKLRLSDELVLSSISGFLELPYKRSSTLEDRFKESFYESNINVAGLFPSIDLNCYFSDAGCDKNASARSINLQRLFSFETYVALRQITIEMQSLPNLPGILRDKFAGSFFNSRLQDWADWVVND